MKNVGFNLQEASKEERKVLKAGNIISEETEEEEDTPLKQKLDDFGEKLSYLIGAVCLIVWIMNYKNFFDEILGSEIKG